MWFYDFTTELPVITGSAVRLHSCMAHAKINRKMGHSTPCKIVTTKKFNLKLCIRDYVGEATHHANFGSNQYSGGLSPYGRNITTLWLCPVLSCPFFCWGTRPSRTAEPIFTLDGSNDVFLRKDGPFGGENGGRPYLGEICPQNPPKMDVNRQFQAKTAKDKNRNISKTVHRIKTKFEDRVDTDNCTSWVV